MTSVAGESPHEPIARLTVEQYHRLIRSEMLTEDDPVELIEGLLFLKGRKTPPHSTSSGLTRQAVESLLPEGWFYDSQNPITLEDGEPEPDGVIVRGRIDEHLAAHPGPRDVAVVIEVADTSLKLDRGIKHRSYARAGISVYLIINLIDRQVELFTDPDPAAKPHPTYRRSSVLRSGESVPLAWPGADVGPIHVDALLPPLA